ncbi:CerR family C-terminal domain-containing protein [Mesorhizobium sp. WSM2239]|uniref:CerR family C-terminal domain-containing protein n=2 Tax=unclassified Mesorhizobium TaxID=325217 RepID=A0AAU8D8J1_9HYPH
MIEAPQNPTPLKAPPSSAELTRAALIHAALRLFGRQGFHATSTREIAAAARANIGSIAYHFGGKEGLRAACANHIVETIGGIAGAAMAEEAGEAKGAEAARARLSIVLEAMVGFIVARPEAGEFVQFVLRELSQPSEALDIIYEGVFEPVHNRLCRIWAEATGEDAESERTKITVFTMIGQVVYFRIAGPAVMRRMGWQGIGPAEAEAVISVVKSNLEAIIAERKSEKP